jgi:hypothetical protein
MRRVIALIAILHSGAGVCFAEYHTNTITTTNGIFAYFVDGGTEQDPVIDLVAGVTNILDIQTAIDHPVIIVQPDDFQFYPGANPQNVNEEPITVITPSAGFPTLLYYVCSVHGFFGEIHFTAPAGPPPPNTILQVQVGTNIVMISTGTNTTWHLVPEFSSNLVNWASVPSFTNFFANGTNTTVFDRLDPICGPNVLLRLRQDQN